MARTAAIFNIDELVIIDDTPQRKDGTVSAGAAFLARVAQYLETPQYLRKALIPMHTDLRLAGEKEGQEEGVGREGCSREQRGQGAYRGDKRDCNSRQQGSSKRGKQQRGPSSKGAPTHTLGYEQCRHYSTPCLDVPLIHGSSSSRLKAHSHW